jgi:hypothetical protein
MACACAALLIRDCLLTAYWHCRSEALRTCSMQSQVSSPRPKAQGGGAQPAGPPAPRPGPGAPGGLQMGHHMGSKNRSTGGREVRQGPGGARHVRNKAGGAAPGNLAPVFRPGRWALGGLGVPRSPRRGTSRKNGRLCLCLCWAAGGPWGLQMGHHMGSKNRGARGRPGGARHVRNKAGGAAPGNLAPVFRPWSGREAAPPKDRS